MSDSVKFIAYYLPQFYEIEFNNRYWGKGHTEWTTTAKAKPLFKGHYQPHVPADLGFYNLLMPEARKAQADMAREYGVDGFCYWHYWFGNGKTIMEKPFNAVLESGEPDFPFCLCWANHSWHNPATKEIILKQEYFGEQDYINHFKSLLPAFKDRRYIQVGGKPLFGIFEAESIPDCKAFIDIWNNLAIKNGFEGIYFVGISQTPDELKAIKDCGLNAINNVRLKDFHLHTNFIQSYIKAKFSKFNDYSYSEAMKYFISSEDIAEDYIPTIIPGWDHSPRAGRKSLILTDYTPEAFGKHVRSVLDVVSKKQNKLCFIKAWNEWGEGNHLEPDLKWGRAFLEVLKNVKEEYTL